MNAVALRHPKIANSVLQPFQAVCPSLEIITDSSELMQRIDAAVIFGGDGTVHRYLPELHEYKIPTVVVPVGSGNDFARTLGIGSVGTALNAWTEYCRNPKNVREIDLGVIRSGGKQTLFCGVAGAGLDADSNERANRMPMWLRRRGGYVLAALWSLAVGSPGNVRVSSPEIENKGMVWFVAVGNGHRYGGGLKITPHASLEDGLLDVCLVGKMNKVKLLWALPSVFWGAHLKLKEVHYFRTASVFLEADQALNVYADGEPICRTPAEFSVRPKALKVIVPG